MCSTLFPGSLFSASGTRLSCALFLAGVQFSRLPRVPRVLVCFLVVFDLPVFAFDVLFMSNSGLCFLVYFICSRTRSPRLWDVNYIWKQLYLIASSRDRKGQSYPAQYFLESVEEYSDGKVLTMSENEPRNGNVNTVYSLGPVHMEVGDPR